MLAESPSVLVVAGAEGSGKTTLVEWLVGAGGDFGEIISIERLANEIHSNDGRQENARSLANLLSEVCIGARRDFLLETELSTAALKLLAKAKTAGFFVMLYFIGTDDPQTNLDRIAAEFHDELSRRRFVNRWRQSMELLPFAIRSSDRAFVFDNSTTASNALGPKLFFSWDVARDAWRFCHRTHAYPGATVGRLPHWIEQYVCEGLGLDADAAPLADDEPPALIPISLRLSLLDLHEGVCHWPVGDPASPDFFFCGGKALSGLPYCAHHSRVAYQPAADRRRSPRGVSLEQEPPETEK